MGNYSGPNCATIRLIDNLDMPEPLKQPSIGLIESVATIFQLHNRRSGPWLSILTNSRRSQSHCASIDGRNCPTSRECR